jgi:aminopeptidase N
MKRMVFLSLLILSFLPLKAQGLEDGVSLKLAQYRSQHLSEITYNLHFDIPAEREKQVTGHAEIIFQWNGDDDLPLDFCGAGFSGTCLVNKKKLKVEWEREHIIIPKKSLKKGGNVISLDFEASNKALNRSEDYMYTIFVPALARSVFPCFDQPDLKAKFVLDLKVPEGWKQMTSADSHPIPTYLFSFVAGKFQEATAQKDGRNLRALYRETDAKKTAQLDKVFDEAALSIRWMENYTGIKYPFDKYGFVVLPGYQFGGMEHPGAIQFTDREVFLGENPTPDEELTRLELIAHETAHMWFGDLVTMKWFDDVWTKEVFANFFAAKISREQFPDINHDLNFLKAYQTRALATDRTDGTHPIQQELNNLKDAGLLYGNIIYDKAPVMMRKLEQQTGTDIFRNSLQKYLKQFEYGNATWDNLIDIINAECPQAEVKAFSDVWVKEKGLPTIYTRYENGKLIITQKDPWERGLVWKQKFKMGLFLPNDKGIKSIDVDMQGPQTEVQIGKKPYAILPNYDGSGYGRFVMDNLACAEEEYAWRTMPQELNRYAAIMNLYENYLMGLIKPGQYLNTMNTFLMNEENPLVASTLCDYLISAYDDLDIGSKKYFEYYLYNDALNHPAKSIRKKMIRILSQCCLSSSVVNSIYDLWQKKADSTLDERDYTNMAYHLAIMKPDKWQEILQTQRSRIQNSDEQRAFDYISRACNPDIGVQQQLFQSLLDVKNRSVEPWSAKMLSLLNTAAREPLNNGFLTLGLNEIRQIQQTGDIFFTDNWLGALLGGHSSNEAKAMVKSWILTHPNYPEPLLNKVKVNAYYLLRNYR